MRRGAATILLFAASLAFAGALAILLTGGVAVPAIAVSLRDPLRPCLAGLILIAAARVSTDGATFRRLVQRYTGAWSELPARLAVLAAACTFVFGVAWTSRAAGGSDSSCYVLQAEAFARGHATLANPVAAVLPDASNAVFAPTGFVASRTTYGAAVPICAPGLAVAMAAAYLLHPGAVFLVVPVSAALLVWLTFVYGRRLDGDVTGVYAAVLVACSPIFLYQAVQPMSDVPAASAWMAAMVSASPLAAGVWASIAILIRPNLALMVVPLLFLKKGTAPVFGEGKRGQPPFWKRGLSPFLGAAVPGVALLLGLNFARYGGVFASGYGDAGTLFSVARVGENLARYPMWILETHTPFVLLAIAAPWVLRRDPDRARLAWKSLLSVALLTATYLAYTVFDDWWYLRFLLPAFPIVLAMSVAVLRSLLAWLPASAGRATLAVICVALCAWYLHVALTRHVTELQALESRFVLAGEYAGRNLPPNAVVLAVQQSGSIRFHGRRDTIAWDAIPPGALDATVERLRASGRAPYIALEDAEEERFRRRFAGQRAGALDARPIAELPAPGRVRFYDIPVNKTR